VEQIAGEYSRRMLDARNPTVATPLGPVGRFDPRGNPALATYRGEIDRLTATAVKILVAPVPTPTPDALSTPAGGAACAKCHDLSPPTDRPLLPTVVPVATPAVWLPGARFSHASHRAVTCANCHPGTGAAFFGSGWTAEKEPIAVAGVDSCKQCHGPTRVVSDPDGARRRIGGVKYGCSDCHQYHNGDHPLKGRGVRGPARTLSADDFSHNP
jgi:hypothetical protein